MFNLPTDVLQRIFDHLSLSSIVLCSHVSPTWRVIARAHPTFSRDIWLVNHDATGPSPAISDFLVTRAHCNTGIINLHLHVSKPSAFVTDTMLPLVSELMDRVVELRVTVHPSFAADLREAVARPAPRLERLHLDFHDPQTKLTILELDSTFLGGSAPRLTTFTTRGFACAAGTSAIPAFASVKVTLIYGPLQYTPPQDVAFFQRMLQLLPNIERLSLKGQSWKGSWKDFALRPAPRAVELGFVSPTTVELFGALTSQDTQVVTTTGSYLRPDAFSFLVEHLVGPLTLEMTLKASGSGMYVVRLKDMHGRVRQMDYIDVSLAGWLESEVPGNLQAIFPTVVGRIKRIAISMGLWDNMLVLATGFPGVTEATVYVESGLAGVNGATLASVRCPQLETVEISSSDGDVVHATWIAKLMGHTFRCAARRNLSLVLKRCNLDGDPNLVWGYFSCIRLDAA